ncbi:MAG: endo-1,4-D-glucanase [Gallionellaceae bacterium CG1_02_56_997]|nr:MAG: endo-1,4-D-glucanase [Gallionellaceae bacterium CG1_02_56_997]
MRCCCGFALCGLCLIVMPIVAQSAPCGDWPLWREFGNHFIQPDGRVLADEGEHRYSTSEGQSYALFFALTANDRSAFERILSWTQDNLAGGDLGARLPAWQWGKKPDGTWGVADANSAADADIWLAYTLLEAGRLWDEPRYTAQARLLMANIRIHLIREISGIGMVLLPAETGFELAGGVRLNPSYYPVHLLRALAKADTSVPWLKVLANAQATMKAVSGKGFVPDWVAYQPGVGFMPDKPSGSIGQHDAIRVYLWWGMLSRQDALFASLKSMLVGMDRLIPRELTSPPLAVDTQTGQVSGISPVGFSAALLPYFTATGNKVALRLQRERLIAQTDTNTGVLIGQDKRYYDQVLALFGLGFTEQRFSFSSRGQLVTSWKSSCSK